jgi:hypothetical protein
LDHFAHWGVLVDEFKTMEQMGDTILVKHTQYVFHVQLLGDSETFKVLKEGFNVSRWHKRFY